MALLQRLSVLALRELVRGLCPALGARGIEEMVAAVTGKLVQHFSDPSHKLTRALQTANDRAWRALELALAGDSWWERIKVTAASAEDQALRQQVRSFLDVVPLGEFSSKAQFCQQCGLELRAARKANLLTAGSLDPRELARQAGDFARHADATGLLDDEWQAVQGMAEELRQAGYPNLGWLLAQRPHQDMPLLLVVVRYFFRRQVETNPELFQGLVFDRIGGLSQALEVGLAALGDAFDRHGQRLEQLLADVHSVVVATHGAVLRVEDEIQRQGKQVQELGQAVLQVLAQHQLQRRELRPGDSLSIRDEGERKLVRQLVERYRTLPGEQRRQLPALLNAVGKLEVVAGEFDAAQQDFQQVAALVEEPNAQAEAHFNSYQAALERRDWTGAFRELIGAVKIDARRFAPFPMGKYHPLRILGGGGFGVAFLCKHRQMDAPMVVKALRVDHLDRDLDRVFTEAQVLKQLDHPAIIRVADCAYLDAAKKSRPYLVMDYFDGTTLEQYVQKQGPLPPNDLLAVARPVAEALQAAHGKGILHRDVKPANLLVRRDAAGWQVKLIDFGLALRQTTMLSTASTPGALGRTLAGSTIAGTLDYAAPEQMGRLPGVAVGPHSDIFGFGKTCCFALFQTAQPRRQHWNKLPEPLADLLDSCLAEQPKERPASFAVVLDRMKSLGGGLPGPLAPSAVNLTELMIEDTAAGEVSPAAKSLVEGLTSQDGAVRQRSATELMKLGDVSAVPALMKRVADDVWLTGQLHGWQNDPNGGGKQAAVQALQTLAPDKTSRALLQAVCSKTEAVREWACEQLGTQDDPASAAGLIQALNDRTGTVKVAAANALGRRKEASAREALARLLGDRRDDSVRLAAVNALAAIGEGPSEALILALNDPRGEVRRVAAECLGKMDDPSAVPALMKRVADDVWVSGHRYDHENDPHAGGKRAALQALKLLAPDKVSPALVQALGSKEPWVRVWASELLAYENDQASAAGLIRALTDRAELVRQKAANALGQRKETSAREALQKLLKDSDGSVRTTAEEALAKIGN